MRLSLAWLLFSVAAAPDPVPSPDRAFQQALSGEWAGYLEYRDYSEPPTSTKRVQLPTWLSVSASGNALLLHYIYDDGPDKIVESTEQLTTDFAGNHYKIEESGHAPQLSSVTGADSLKNGRGILVLTRTGTDNNQPADLRVTLTLRRNLAEWLEEVRPSGSSGPFVFRHLLRVTRAQPPQKYH